MIFDPDNPKPQLKRPPVPDMVDSIMIGITRIKTLDLLQRFGERWADVIRASNRADEVRKAWAARKKELGR